MKLRQVIIASATAIVVGFIPWENMFSIEFRSSFFSWLMGGVLALIGLMLFIAAVLIYVMRKNGRFAGIATLLLPLLLLPLSFVLIISFLGPAEWQDQSTYFDGHKYLILEGRTFGRDGVDMEYRLIRTTSPGSLLRKIEKYPFKKGEEEIFFIDTLPYKGVVWYKQMKRRNLKL